MADVSEITPEQAEMASAVAFCFGPDLGPERCRQHVMTAPGDPDHGGIDHICGLPENHDNRHRCAREACGYEWVQGGER